MSLDIQRQNYIADIHHSISEVELELRNIDRDMKQIDDLIDLCKVNKMRKFKKVVKFEKKIALKKKDWLIFHKKQLVTLLGLAERYAPGKTRG